MSIRIQISGGTEAYMKLLDLPDLTFTEEQLKSKYREAAMQHHPDKGGNKDKFIQVKDAYEALKIFASVSIDKVGTIGATGKKMEILKPGFIWEDCSSCEGQGFKYTATYTAHEICSNCSGTGFFKLPCRSCKGSGTFKLRNGRDVECRECKGSGVHKKVYCNICNTKELDAERRMSRSFWFGDVPPIGKVKKEMKSGKSICIKCEGSGKFQKEQLNPVLRSGSIR